MMLTLSFIAVIKRGSLIINTVYIAHAVIKKTAKQMAQKIYKNKNI